MENYWNDVRNNNSLRLMLIKDILHDKTDENHFITIGEILNILNSYGISAVRQTIYDDIDLLIEAGYDIDCVPGRNNTNMYHLVSREFEMAELRLLIDAVESIRSLPIAKCNSLKEKICKLGGPSADFLLQCTSKNDLTRTENPQIYYIIDTVNEAISTKRQITFKYCEHLSASKKPLKREGIEYKVSPYRLVCYINYYYLIAFSEKHMKTMAFRMDCICEIPEILKVFCVPESEGFRVNKTINDISETNQGKQSKLLLEFDNSVADVMANRFGDDMKIVTIGDPYCRAKVLVDVDNAFFAWIFKSDGKISIVGPRDIRDRYILMVSKAMARL